MLPYSDRRKVIMKILILGMLFSSFIHAEELTTQCQQNLDAIVKMSAGAESLKAQCLEAVTKDYLEKKQKEVNVLNEYTKYLTVELKKVAVSVNTVMVNCGVESMRKMELVFKCRQLSNQRDIANSRIQRLENWEKNLKANLKLNPVPLESIMPHPCASSMELEALKGIERMNKNLFQSWMNCP